jgi:threonine synthase
MNGAALVCAAAGERYGADEPRWRGDSGELLDLEWTPAFFPERIRQRSPNLWRYREAIPVREDRNIVSFGEGFTPLFPATLAGQKILIKLDHLFPTGSYKDRGATVLISKARELGIRAVVQDSSGNAGVSIACYSALAGIRCEIFVPASTSPAKLVQIRHAGATLREIPGSREDTARAARKRAEEVYYASHCWNPFFHHGTKTFAFELWEQLSWRAPGTIILPAGNGTLVLGTWIGFRELMEAGFLDRMPVIVAVQASACAPLAAAFLQPSAHTLPAIELHPTAAEGIAIAEPVRWKGIVQAVRETGGIVQTVEEAEILGALRETGAMGLCIEPTAAAAVAGAKKYLAQNDAVGPVVTVVTGHGLKSPEKLLPHP